LNQKKSGEAVYVRYPEQLIKIMREDLTRHGIVETRTAEDVDRLLQENPGATVMMVVNSVCGCAAGKARPGVVAALEHDVVPEISATAFAGADLEAVARIRELAPNIAPSSPAVYLFRDGKPVYALPRNGIETRQSFEIAEVLRTAFNQYCKQTQSKG